MYIYSESVQDVAKHPAIHYMPVSLQVHIDHIVSYTQRL